MINIISSAIDTIECSFRGRFDSDIYLDLLNIKKKARDNNECVEYYVDLNNSNETIKIKFLVRPHGSSMYALILNNELFDLSLSPSTKIPFIKARIRSIALYEKGVDKVLNILYLVARFFKQDSEPIVKLSRIDLCADFQGWIPELEDIGKFSTKAKKKCLYLDQSNLPNYFGYGAKNMYARLYNKGEEIKEDNKLWFIPIWEKNPLFDINKPIWRLEYEIKRPTLKSLQIDTPEEAIESLKGLWSYGLDWFNLKCPTNNKQKTRWPEDDKWTFLRENALFDGKPVKRVRIVKKQAEEESLIKMIAGLTTSHAAIFNNIAMDAAFIHIKSKVRRYYEEKGLDFATSVMDKMKHRVETHDNPF